MLSTTLVIIGMQSRHRAESVYSVQNLTQLLSVAGRIADALP